LLEQVEQRFPGYVEAAESAEGDLNAMAALGYRVANVSSALQYSTEALERYQADGMLDGAATGNARRAVIDSGVPAESELTAEAATLLRPADNYGGRMAFFWVAPFGLAVALVFLVLYIRDRRTGGYTAVRLDQVSSA
jgi:hypothetical protein